MIVTPDVIGTIAAVFSAAVAFFVGVAGMLVWQTRRLDGRLASFETLMDARFTRVDQRFTDVDRRFEEIDRRFEKIDERFDRVDQRFDRVDQRFEKVDAELGGLRTELVDVKIAVARWEGPAPRLLRPSR